MRRSFVKTILAIETSCDETAAAVLEMRGGGKWPQIKTLSSLVRSQIQLHSKMGGVVPEAAARAHVKYIRPVIGTALNVARCPLPAVDYIAVTAGPGLMPSLMVGVEFAKALSFATGKPMIPVNHMMGHLYSPFGRVNSKYQIPNTKQNLKSKILNPKSIFPNISLIVSGGHTILVLMKNEKKYRVLGQTVDDAAGEAFDKVAKMLSLPYPGGPQISKLAAKGNPRAIAFPRPMLNHKNYDFSFSGLKTAVLYFIRDNPLSFPRLSLSFPRRRESKKIDSGSLSSANWRIRGGRNDIADVCASFQQAIVDVLAAKTLRAAREFKAKSISLSGGVAANQRLRDELIADCKLLNIKFMAPPMNLCTDNAEMVGIAAAFMLAGGFRPVLYKKVGANSNLQL